MVYTVGKTADKLGEIASTLRCYDKEGQLHMLPAEKRRLPF